LVKKKKIYPIGPNKKKIKKKKGCWLLLIRTFGSVPDYNYIYLIKYDYSKIN